VPEQSPKLWVDFDYAAQKNHAISAPSAAFSARQIKAHPFLFLGPCHLPQSAGVELEAENVVISCGNLFFWKKRESTNSICRT